MARPTQITDETIVAALASGGEVTAAELAGRLGMGQSTAAKRLAALEASGAVRRSPGGRVDGVRVADRWSSAAPRPTLPSLRFSRPAPTSRAPTSRRPAGRVPWRRRRASPRRRPEDRAGWAGGRSGPWCVTTWRPGPARRSGRPRWERPSAGPRGRCPTRWRRWRRAARWSWSASGPAGTGSPADRLGPAHTPRHRTPRGMGCPAPGLGPTPKWGRRAGLRTPHRWQRSPENFFRLSAAAEVGRVPHRGGRWTPPR